MAFDIDVAVTRGSRLIRARFAGAGGITALCGPSGAGKSSVLAAIAGLLRPDCGHIRVGGVTLFDRSTWVKPQARACGIVFQDLRLFPHMSVAANLRYAQARAAPERRVIGYAEVLRFLDIAALAERRPATLSGGEAQRVAIGRALLSGPRFLLLDEPLAALDAPLRDGIMTVIEAIRSEFALPMILVSHDAGQVARLADQVFHISN